MSLGGDIAVAGQTPPGNWRVRVQDVTGRPEDPPVGPSAVVAIRDGGLATSSTTARRWRRGRDAPGWLTSLGLSARLVDEAGNVRTVGGWPADPS